MSKLIKGEKYGYTNIDNHVFMDYQLSAKAKGVLCQMLSLPDYWEFSIAGLSKLFTDGVDSIRTAINELEKNGYLIRSRERKDGKYAGTNYVIFANPQNSKTQEKPMLENPTQGNPMQENPTQYITKQLTTKVSTTKDIHNEFEKLWALYPRKQGKEKARNYYEKTRKSGTTYEEVLKGIVAYKAYIHAEGVENRYIKHGSTFFSQKAWQDDWSISPKKTGNAFYDMMMEGGFE